MPLSKIEKSLLFQILDEMEGSYSRSGCNDFSMPATPENKAFLQAVVKHSFSAADQPEHLKYLDEEYPSGRLGSVDSLVLDFLRSRLKQEV